MLTTGNLGLKKPEGTDTVNIDDLNSNMDTLDAEVVKKASASTDGRMSKEDKSKLDGIESGAEVNNLSDANATDLTDGGNSSLHYHSSDRNRANHTGTQLASTISNFVSTVRSTALTGLSTATNSAITATDNLLTALGKLQAQINNKANSSHTHDSRYYTESEINTQMAGKSNTSHNHSGVYEPVISKKSGFNLDKSDSVTSTSTAVLATSKAAKTAYDKGVQALNTANAKLNSSSYTAADVLNKIKTVDGNGSGLDADRLRGATPSTDDVANSIVQRDSSGNIVVNNNIRFTNDDGFYYDDSTNIMYVKTDDSNHKIWHTGNDGSGSGLDADRLRGVAPSTSNVVNTISQRNSSGDISCRLLRPEYTSTTSTPNYFLVQHATGTGDNYARPCSKAQVKSALGVSSPDSINSMIYGSLL